MLSGQFVLQFFAEVRELPTVLGLGPGISTKEIGSSVGSPRGFGVMHCFAFREDNLHGTGTEPWQNPGTMGLTHCWVAKQVLSGSLCEFTHFCY